MKEETKCYCGHTTTCDCGPEKAKQECMITKIMQMDAEMAYDSLPKQELERGITITHVDKQETLEEVAENFWLNDDSMTDNDRISYVNGFGQGARWQQEQIGKSEFLQKLRGTLSDAEARRLIFETFKNK